LPDLILLDLNLPKKSGKEVLLEIKSDKDLKIIPVIILTTSKNYQDILCSYSLNANCYLVKPVEFEEFLDTVKSIDKFWLTKVNLPTMID
jgi:DNA-binding response OmpR family regulator